MPFIDDRWTLLSHKAMLVENRALRIVILPELGGRIWSVIYKPLDRELLWHNPRIAPRKVPFGAGFDDVWCGGWEEMFPTAAPCTINGELLPDHGEIWSLPWVPEIEQTADTVRVRLTCQTPVSGMTIRKTLILRGDESSFEVSYTVENSGPQEYPFLFALHPAIAVAEGDRVDFPEMLCDRDVSFPGTLGEVPLQFRWPMARGPHSETDLRWVKPPSSQALYMLYGHGFKEGWVAITDPARKFSAGFIYSPEDFPSCWIFATYGGWRRYHTILVEPCTSYPQKIEEAALAGRGKIMAPESSWKATVRFVAQEGLSSVKGVSAGGAFFE